MAVLNLNDSNPINEVIYFGCSKDTLIGKGKDNEKEKLSSIVGYAFKEMGITKKGDNKEECYKFYCQALREKLDGSEPYQASLKVKESNKWKIVEDMKELLPQTNDHFNKLIEKAAGKAAEVLGTDPRDITELLYRHSETEYVASEFSVMKIFRSGENLEIIPCYMAVKGKKVEGRFLLIGYSDTSAEMEYKQEKFYLTKFDMEEIIEQTKKTSKKKWAK